MGVLTKLQAVNRILRAASEYPINSLTQDGVNDSNVAESLLDETNIQEQLEGLNCNVVQAVLHPTTDGEILLPANCLIVDSSGLDTARNLVERAGKLFDVDNNTHTFTESVTVDYAIYLAFEALPTAQQFRVVDQAARLYQMQTVGDRQADALLNEMAKVSRALGRSEDMASRDANLLYNSSSRTARSATVRNFSFNLPSGRVNPRIPG